MQRDQNLEYMLWHMVIDILGMLHFVPIGGKKEGKEW